MRFIASIVFVSLLAASVLAVTPTNPGDLNNDNRVDVSDVFLIVNCLGQTAATCQSGRADPNNDGAVNIYDFIAVSKEWGKTYTAATQLQVTVSPATSNSTSVLAQWPASAGAANYRWSTGRSEHVAWDINGQTTNTQTTLSAPLLTSTEDAYFCYEAVNSQGSTVLSQCTTYTLPAFTSAPPTPDSTPPTVSVSAPANGASISTTTTVTATASDNVAVQSVQFLLDGTSLGGADASAPYSVSLNPASYSAGSHSLTARATDTNANIATSAAIAITIPGAPPTAVCGNGVIEGTESCDSANLNGATCASRGFTGGTLGCSAGCSYNTNACTGQNLYPNKPSNYNRVVSDFDFSEPIPGGTPGNERSVGETGWTVIYDGDAGGSNWQRQSVSDAPQSGPYVWQLHFEPGTWTDGHGAGNIGRPLPSASEIYISYWIKWDANFEFHSISSKQLRMEKSDGNFLIQASHDNTFMRASDEGIGQAYEPQIGTKPTPGVWHHIEAVVKRGSPGTVKVWIDGELRTSYTNLPVSPNNSFQALSIDGHLGGGGMTKTRDSYYWLDHIYLATP